ncbi:hypothetical protein LJC08_06535, partial [Methanimicrococcus sp. OttesenSCG-928-J09]|nr:hypothetical protein [Methanimicrococcus sp. OttesenSCG-928-J09]
YRELLSDIGDLEIMVIVIPDPSRNGRALSYMFTSPYLTIVPDSEIHKIVKEAMADTMDGIAAHYSQTNTDPITPAVLRIEVSKETVLRYCRSPNDFCHS